ncbi:hypothetical protein DACRYDRAFT_116733 [Dacryopinax primogenitus]|uniref:Zn(2)-C6 fungal-type domain-containing protein n=1 Tax=Dacryopinax primogenitus (strain DJM 731) TaxID=1858805 RepID=M5GC89_DACPD|nr:uncharacterized protein DACRYDRAFT_116733 [Dacryopinax primogenitus]EJU01648.1 hypothetical protein DACRYDRAFT_116733 [Dacryopinax primogenitus]
MPSPPQTGYYRPPTRPPANSTVLPGIDELIRGMPRDQMPPEPHRPHAQAPDYTKIPGPPSPPWPNPPRRTDSPAYAYSQPQQQPRPVQGGPMYTPPSSGGSRPPTAPSHSQVSPQGHMVSQIPPHAGQMPPGTNPLPFPSVTYTSPLPPSPNTSTGASANVQAFPPGLPLDGPYYLPSHPYTTIYFAPPNQFGPARNARACKKCRQRKVRCSAAGGLGFAPGEPGMKCERCERAGEECIFEERQVGRRRTQGSGGSNGSGRSSGRSATADEDDEDDEESISTPTATTSTLRTPASSIAGPPRGSTKAGPPPAPSSGSGAASGGGVGRGNPAQGVIQGTQGYGRAQSMPPK